MDINQTYGVGYSHYLEKCVIEMYYQQPDVPITNYRLAEYVRQQLPTPLSANEATRLYQRTVYNMRVLVQVGKMHKSAQLTAKRVVENVYKPIHIQSHLKHSPDGPIAHN